MQTLDGNTRDKPWKRCSLQLFTIGTQTICKRTHFVNPRLWLAYRTPDGALY